jgi:predicted dehydrogenase
LIRIGVVGLGKMGLSHLSMLNAHPDVTVAGVCDTSGYLLSVLGKYSGLRTFSRLDAMFDDAELDAVGICTPSFLHATQVSAALERDLHVFCEKPLCLDPADSWRLAKCAEERGLVTQVGYHNRFIGAFQEVKRLLDAKAIGTVTHVLAEAYGPVVLREKGSTWRSRRAEGGGCLYDYAAHPLNLLTWYFGAAEAVSGSVLGRVFSHDTDDEVASTLRFSGDLDAQLSVGWSDESQRKMTTRITAWGTGGRVFADRQEVQLYVREEATPPPGYTVGWNVRYTTDLTKPVWFYLRGEEYSAQLEAFVARVQNGAEDDDDHGFVSAATTDDVIAAIVTDAARPPTPVGAKLRDPAAPPGRHRRGLRRLFGRRR